MLNVFETFVRLLPAGVRHDSRLWGAKIKRAACARKRTGYNGTMRARRKMTRRVPSLFIGCGDVSGEVTDGAELTCVGACAPYSKPFGSKVLVVTALAEDLAISVHKRGGVKSLCVLSGLWACGCAHVWCARVKMAEHTRHRLE